MYEPERREGHPERPGPGPRYGDRGEAPYREERPPPGSPAPIYNYRAVQVVWFLIGLFEALIAIRFVLKLLAASPQAPFVSFMYGLTGPLVAPFRGIFPDTGQGFYIFEPASLVAMVVYALVGWAAVSLIRILTTPRPG